MNDADIETLCAAFAARTLPKAEWTHAAHFAGALWLLRRGEAERMPEMIRAYNVAVGGVNDDMNGYHHTITLASLRGARAVLLRHGEDAPLSTVLADVLSSPLGRSDWLMAFWSRDRLFTPHARRVWVDPDLAPLPYEELGWT